jgi:type IV pilus assembly protein PilM
LWVGWLFTAEAIWGLDIGDSGIKAVRLTHSKGQVFVDDFGRVDLDEKVKKSDGYLAAVSHALEKLTAKKDFAKTEVCISISTKNANSQFVTLESGLSAKAFQKEITAEAERQIPFPLEEVQWGIHRMGDSDEGVQVALFAARTEYINHLLDVTTKAGLDVRGIQIPGVALYNFVSEMMSIDEDLVILDFGEKSTGLLVMYDDQFWLRSLPLSGSHITTLLEKKFRITTAEANTLKNEMEKSPQLDKLFRVIEPKLKELVIEIKRSINFRRTQAKNLNPKKFIAWGGSSQLPGVSQYFAENLGLELCELNFGSMDFSRCDQAKQLQSQVASYGVAFGLALQGLGLGVSKLNLAPKDFVRQAILKTKRWSLLAANAALLLLSVVSMFEHQSVKAQLDEAEKGLSKTRSLLQKDISKFEDESQKLLPLKNDLDFLTKILKNNLASVAVYEAVRSTIDKVQGVFLTNISMDALSSEDYLRVNSADPQNTRRPIELRLDYVGDSARMNATFYEEILKHPYFAVPEGASAPIPSGLQKKYEWSYTPRVTLAQKDLFGKDPDISEKRKTKGWEFSLEGEKIVTPLKMNAQNLRIMINLDKVLPDILVEGENNG